MKKELIRVLLVEDNPGDARLFQEYLRDDDLAQFEVDRVDRLQTCLERLTQSAPDVVLLDLGLPDSQGWETFKTVIAVAPDVPIVILTGLDDTEQAVLAVRAGAQDYLVKGDISSGLISRAIRYAIERMQADKAVMASNSFNTMLLKTIPFGLDIVNESGQVLFMNSVFENVFGKDAPGKQCWDLYKDDKQQCTGCPLREEIVPGKTVTVETTGVLGGRTFEITHTGMVFQGHKAVMEIFSDITERKHAEDALASSNAELSAVFAGMTDLVIVYNSDGRYIKVAPTNPVNMYQPLESLTGRTVHDVLPKEQADYIVSKIRAAIQSGKTVNGEYSLPIDGKEIWYTSSASRLTENTVVWVAHDITNRKKIEDEIRQHSGELEAVYAGSLEIGRLLQPQEIGRKLLEILSERLQWHNSAILLYNPKKGMIEFLALRQPGLENESARLAAQTRFQSKITRSTEGITGWVLQHGQPVYSGDLTRDSRYIEIWPGRRSGMYVPLKAGERTMGCLVVESERVNAFTEKDEWLLTTLAAQAAGALENASLFSETRRRLTQTQALREIDLAIAGSMDLDDVLEVALQHVITELGVDAAVILLKEPRKPVLKYRRGKGLRTNALQSTKLQVGDGFAGQVALDRQIRFVPDIQASKTDFLRSPSFSQEGFVSYFGVPLLVKGEIIGVLEIFHRSPLDPGDERLGFMEILAGQIAIAIDNATLYEDLQKSNRELSLAYDATIEGWSHALDLRDRETEGHTRRVTKMAVRLAENLGIPESDIKDIQYGALLHDIGKMGIPDSILLKPGKLTEEEWVTMKKHPVFAYEMLAPIDYLKNALDIPHHHHEKWDGSGYPDGLKGVQIPLAARLFAIVDVFDALTSDRPYRKSWSHRDALKYMAEQSGTHFCPEILDVFLKIEGWTGNGEPG